MGLFTKATKSQSRLRLGLVGPPGSGKTFSALSIAASMAQRLATSGRIAVIDTEFGSASKYSDEFSFETLQLGDFDPRRYIEALLAAAREGFQVVVIDSLSHAWMGKGGALEMVDNAAKRSRSGNTYTAWREVTPVHRALVEAILQSPCHVIATMRSKVDYVLETDPSTGKQAPRKVGMAPIQREGMDYEFDVVGDLDEAHNLIISKTRCRALDGKVINRPGRDFAEILMGWLSDGTPAASPRSIAPATPLAGLVDADTVSALLDLRTALGMSDQQWLGALARRGVSEVGRLSATDATAMVETLTLLFHKKQSDESKFPLEATTQVAPASPDPIGSPIGEPTRDPINAAEPAGSPEPAEDFEVPDATRPERPSRRNRSRKGDQPAPASGDTEVTDMNDSTPTLTAIEA